MICCQNNNTNPRGTRADPRLLGALRKTGGLMKEWMNAFVHVSLGLETRSQKALEKQYLFRGSARFQLVLSFCLKQKTEHEFTDFYIERVTAPH